MKILNWKSQPSKHTVQISSNDKKTPQTIKRHLPIIEGSALYTSCILGFPLLVVFFFSPKSYHSSK